MKRSGNTFTLFKNRAAALFAGLLAAVIVLSLTQSCRKSYKDPNLLEAKITSFKMTGFTSAKISVDALIENPNNFSFKVVGVNGAVLSGGIEIATFMCSDELEVPKLSTQNYAFVVGVDVTDVQNVLQLISSSQDIDLEALTVNLTANVKKAGITVPVTRTGIPMSRFFKNGLSFDKLF